MTISSIMPSPFDGSLKVNSAFKIDAHRGTTDSTVSRQWSTRSDDEKFLSLSSLRDYLTEQTHASRAVELDTKALHVLAGNNGSLSLTAKRGNMPDVDFSNWSFGQMAVKMGAPAGYLKKLPAELAADCLNHGIQNARAESILSYYRADNKSLRALTSPDYGRIFDLDIVKSVMEVAGNGTGDTRWKVPGMIDWANSMYNPYVDVSKETTTLYASDRDVFLFLVDDTHPIEVGSLPDGSPDLMFRGFIVQNSEVGSSRFAITCFMLRGVCCNRNLWGVEGKTELSIRHTKNAVARFEGGFEKALLDYANQSASGVANKVMASKGAIIATDDDEAMEFLGRLEFSKSQATEIMECVVNEEQRDMRTIWDATQGITAFARRIPYQNERVRIERIAGRLMDKIN